MLKSLLTLVFIVKRAHFIDSETEGLREVEFSRRLSASWWQSWGEDPG